MENGKSFLLREIPPALHQDLKILAAVEQSTMREIILRAVEEHVDREKRRG